MSRWAALVTIVVCSLLVLGSAGSKPTDSVREEYRDSMIRRITAAADRLQSYRQETRAELVQQFSKAVRR